MDSITQASLGALCGELVLGRKLGYKGALWGLFFGTLPDLDIIAYKFLTLTEQLRWHRGLSHSLLAVILGALLFGWLLKWIHQKRGVHYLRFCTFVFFALSTHILIDCFNTYGTQIMEPFHSTRYAINNIAIIDLFFLLPLLLGLFLTLIVFRKRRNVRSTIGWITALWLCLYFVASLFMKHLATRKFEALLTSQGVEVKEILTAPSISNIFLWRMCAQDNTHFYISYWSIFDKNGRKPVIRSFPKQHDLEQGFEDSKDLETIKWFCQGWHKTFQLENEPESIYLAAVNMAEIRYRIIPPIAETASTKHLTELRPSFLWKITKTDQGYEVQRPFKMTKDIYGNLVQAIKRTINRVKGGEPNWMQGDWSWDLYTLKQ